MGMIWTVLEAWERNHFDKNMVKSPPLPEPQPPNKHPNYQITLQYYPPINPIRLTFVPYISI